MRDLHPPQLSGELAVAPKGHHFKILCYASQHRDELLEMVVWSIRGLRKP